MSLRDTVNKRRATPNGVMGSNAVIETPIQVLMTDNCWCLHSDKCDSILKVQMSRFNSGLDSLEAPLGLVYLTGPQPSADEFLASFSLLVRRSWAVYFPLTTSLHSKSHFIVSRDCGLLPWPVCWLPVAINAQYLCWGLSTWSYFILCCVLSCPPI